MQEEENSILADLAILPQEFKHKEVTRLGGLTNRNYKITTENGTSFLFKVLAEGMDFFFSRKDEMVVKTFLAEKGFPLPKLIWSNEKAIVEEFIEGKVIEKEELVGLYQDKLTDILINLHGVSQKEISLGEKKPKLYAFLSSITNLRSKISSELENDPSCPFYLSILNEIVEDAGFLKDELGRFESQVVFCHNDVNPSNIYQVAPGIHFPNSDGTFADLILLDYEYAGFNYLYYELANIMHELELEFLDGPPHLIIAEFPASLDIITKYYHKSPISKSIELKDFIENCQYFTMYCYMYWTVLCIHDFKRTQWEGTRNYVEKKMKVYREKRDKYHPLLRKE